MTSEYQKKRQKGYKFKTTNVSKSICSYTKFFNSVPFKSAKILASIKNLLVLQGTKFLKQNEKLR